MTDAFIDFGGVPLYPTKDGRVIHVESALTHHLFDIAIRELIATIPTNTQKDGRRLEVSPLERGVGLLHEDDSRRVMAELKGGL